MSGDEKLLNQLWQWTSSPYQAHPGYKKPHGAIGEYVEGLRWVKENIDKPKVVLFLGSNLGNLNETQAIVFLRTIWNSLAAGTYLLWEWT